MDEILDENWIPRWRGEKKKQSKITSFFTPRAAAKKPRMVEEVMIDEKKVDDVEPLEEEVADDE